MVIFHGTLLKELESEGFGALQRITPFHFPQMQLDMLTISSHFLFYFIFSASAFLFAKGDYFCIKK